MAEVTRSLFTPLQVSWRPPSGNFFLGRWREEALAQCNGCSMACGQATTSPCQT